MIAAGLCGWVVFVYVLISEDIADKLNLLSRFGLVKAFEARQVRIKEEYVERLSEVRAHIDVIGFGLNAFREDFLQEFPKWKQRANVRVLRKALYRADCWYPHFAARMKNLLNQREPMMARSSQARFCMCPDLSICLHSHQSPLSRPCPRSHCFLGALIGEGREGAVWSEPRAGNLLGKPALPFGPG